MARQEINLGTAPTGLGGDPPRTASQKINFMTQELYEGLATTATPLPIVKGGTGGKTPEAARTGLGLRDAALMDAVGAGGIIERGATANGEFTKFADGTLICRGVTEAVDVNTPSGGMFYNQIPPYNTYPHVFSGVPVCVGTAVRSGTDTSTFSGACEVIESSTSLSGRWRTYGVQAGRVYFRYLAIGRWKA